MSDPDSDPRSPTDPLSLLPAKAAASDYAGRFREILSDPLNLLIRRHPQAGIVAEGLVTLHNGHRVPVAGAESYYDSFSQILLLNRGVHEPLEEFIFQEVLRQLPEAPSMLELGAYWGHYSMWLMQARPAGRVHLVEPEAANLAAGRANFARNGHAGSFAQGFVGPGGFGVDAWLADGGGKSGLDILHCDIQGHEAAMLEGAAATLAAARVGYWFVSTHSQPLHRGVCDRLAAAGYRIEVAADFDEGSTSYDGFVLAVHPDRPRLLPGPAPLGRVEILGAEPRHLLDSLVALQR